MVSENSENRFPRDIAWKERATALAKGVAGTVPIIGSLLSEAVGLLIPNYRLERIEAFIRLLADRLAYVEEAALRQKMTDGDALCFLELGIELAMRTASPVRREQIANIVVHGLTTDERAIIEDRRLLTLLNEIDDDQVVILMSYLKKYKTKAFFDKHQDILIGRPDQNDLVSSVAYVEAKWFHEYMRRADFERALYNLAYAQLVRLGLLGVSGGSNAKREGRPVVDSIEGTYLPDGLHITKLGRLLLVRMDLAVSTD
jgi:hypothetical protein